jgi:hypothetical protein
MPPKAKPNRCEYSPTVQETALVGSFDVLPNEISRPSGANR